MTYSQGHLHPLQFEHFVRAGKHHIEAFHGGEVVGALSWHKERTVPHPLTGAPLHGTITDISVDRENRRKGIATEMFHYGQQFSPPPAHSPSRTPEGNAWAKSVGGKTPPTFAQLHLSQAERERRNL